MLQIKDIMTTDVFFLKQSDSLKTARSMMTLARIRHIPIVSDSVIFSGLVTHRDILGATISKFAEVDKTVQDEIDAGIPVSEIMRHDVLTVASTTLVREAAKMLLENKYGCLPVVDQGKLKGIVTEADFLKLTIKLLEQVGKIEM
ncbi:MAG: CBS domain-containing protein [Desulfovibrio sp.]|mgnify:FL=1|nr:MAG: CBS domain-containing protein [Desulfovibrio sp.]